MRVEQFIGGEADFSLRHKLLNSILLLGLSLSFWSSLINFIIEMPSYAVCTPALTGFFLVGLYYLSRVKRHYNLPIGMALLLIAIAVPICWFQTGGSLGRAPIYITLFVPMVAVLLVGMKRIAAIIMLIILPDSLIFWEFFHPLPLLMPINSIERYTDLAVTLTTSIIASATVFSIITGYYMQEYSRANIYLKKSLQAQQDLRFLSFNDTLTSTHNRACFEAELLQLENGTNQQIGVFFFDVDGLKFVNDTLGHGCGDKLLQNAADFLRSIFLDVGSIFRIGGDEFVILLQNTDEKTLEQLYSKAQMRLHEDSLQKNNAEIPLQLSFGYGFGSNCDVRNLSKEAEGKMYREKISHNVGYNSTVIQIVEKMQAARDNSTASHSERMENLLLNFAKLIGIAPSTMADLKLFARFHDIGKVGVPDHILLKPSVLTEDERLAMQKHSEIGCRLAHTSSTLLPIANWILKHHEWWNGKGYPLGLAGKEIPFECRILAIIDGYDAMISDRPYRKGMSPGAALKELKRCAGSQFDPNLALRFVAMVENQDIAVNIISDTRG